MSYTLIPQSKVGDCSFCSNKNTRVRKVQKDFYCLSRCYPKLKRKEATDKFNKKHGVSAYTKSKVRSLSKLPKNIEMVEGNKIRKAEADLFWLHAENEIKANPQCYCCKERFDNPNNQAYWKFRSNVKEFARFATGHIFAKAIFPSVAYHLSNYVIVPAECCHELTHRLDKFSQSGCFGEAVRRFRIFEPFITEKHKYLDEFRRLADEYEEKVFMEKENGNNN